LWKSVDKSEAAASVILIALGLFVVRQSLGWEYMTRDGPGPGFFPMWIGIALVVLPALYMATHVFDVKRGEAVHRTDWSGTRAVMLGWAAFMLIIVLIKPIGFIGALVVMMLIYVRLVFGRSLLAAIAVAVGSSLAFWGLFVKLLNLRLPVGPWGF
jgi:putative tricarboxylic transport membrane protein